LPRCGVRQKVGNCPLFGGGKKRHLELIAAVFVRNPSGFHDEEEEEEEAASR